MMEVTLMMKMMMVMVMVMITIEKMIYMGCLYKNSFAESVNSVFAQLSRCF